MQQMNAVYDQQRFEVGELNDRIDGPLHPAIGGQESEIAD